MLRPFHNSLLPLLLVLTFAGGTTAGNLYFYSNETPEIQVQIKELDIWCL
jgi:hypothetical protein